MTKFFICFSLFLIFLTKLVNSSCDNQCVCSSYIFDEAPRRNQCNTDCECTSTRRCSIYGYCHECQTLGTCPKNIDSDSFSITSQQAVDAFKKVLAPVNRNLPTQISSYVRNFKTDIDFSAETFAISELNRYLNDKKSELKEEEIKKFQRLSYINSIEFESFSFNANYENGIMNEFIGLGRKIDNKIQIAYVNLYITGELIQPTQTIITEKCRKIFFFFTKCYKIQNQVLRGYDSGEMMIIQDGLRAFGYQELDRKLANIGKIPTLFLLDQIFNMEYKTQEKKFLNFVIDENNIENEKELNDFIKNSYDNNYYNNLIGDKSNEIFEKIKIVKYIAIDRKLINYFKLQLKCDLDLEADNNNLIDEMIDNIEGNKWNNVNYLIDLKHGKNLFSKILARNRYNNEYIDFLISFVEFEINDQFINEKNQLIKNLDNIILQKLLEKDFQYAKN